MLFRAKILRALTKKPYGVAYFKVGKQLYPRLIRLDRDSIRFGNGIWIIDHSKVYIENSEIKPEKPEKPGKQLPEIDSRTGQPIRREFNMVDFYNYSQGIPVIFFDYNDMVALKLEGDKFEGTRNPFVVEATIDKELSASEAEMMRKTKSKVIKYVFASIAVTVGLYIAVAYLYTELSSIKSMVSLLLPLVGS